MKNNIKISSIILGLFLVVFVSPFVSCSKDDDGAPEIHQVRITDPAKVDSTFTNAFPGQMIVIEGRNLGAVQQLFINGQNVSFNPNYVTSRSIIASIPAELALVGTDPEIPNEIRVQTSSGIAVFSFHVLSPAPIISRIEMQYPAQTGKQIKIHGSNFFEVIKVVFEGTNGTNVETTNYTINKDYSIITLDTPAGVADGEIAVYCYTAKASTKFLTIPPAPEITSLSSDMPIIGSEMFIVGQYFLDVTKVNVNGEYDIEAVSLKVSASEDTIYLKLPTAPTAVGKITVTAAGGNSNSNLAFYPVANVVANFDGIGSFNWGNDQLENVEGDGTSAPYITTGKAIGIKVSIPVGGGWQGNLIMNMAHTDAIPDNTPISDLVVRYECYNVNALGTANFTYAFLSAWDGQQNGYIPVSMITRKTELGKWMTVEVPLSYTVKNAATYGEAKAGGESTMFAMLAKGGSTIIPLEIYFDNFRVLKK